MSNLTPQQVMDGMSERNRMLTQKNDEYVTLIEKRAQAERTYNISVATTTISLKSTGTPVTIIPTLVKGDKMVADLKYTFDVAVGVEKACLESIKDVRSKIDSYRSLLAWMKAELLNS